MPLHKSIHLLSQRLPTLVEGLHEDLKKVHRKYRAVGNLHVVRGHDPTHLSHILELDKSPVGFLPPNQLGDRNLRNLWKADKSGFYLLYQDNEPIGYCDVFGLSPKAKFINEMKNAHSTLDLPDAGKLCDAIIPRSKWKDNPIELYIDAILVPSQEYSCYGAFKLVTGVCEDLMTYYDTYVTQIGTVAVQNSLDAEWDPTHADNYRALSCIGARLAVKCGLNWGEYKIVGHEEKMQLGRFLYVSRLGPIPNFQRHLQFAITSRFLKIGILLQAMPAEAIHAAWEKIGDILKGE